MILIITSAEVKTTAGLNKNIEDRKLRPWIELAQNDLRTNIGEDGYAAVVAWLTVPTTPYTTWVEGYVKPFLAYKVRQLSAVSLWKEADRNGNFERRGESYKSADKSDLGIEKSDARDLAESWFSMMMNYVKDHATDFPWYAELKPQGQRPYTGGVITRLTDRCRDGEGYYNGDGYPDECCDHGY